MSNSGQNVKNEALREVAFGHINATLTALGDPLSHLRLFEDSEDAKSIIYTEAVSYE